RGANASSPPALRRAPGTGSANPDGAYSGRSRDHSFPSGLPYHPTPGRSPRGGPLRHGSEWPAGDFSGGWRVAPPPACAKSSNDDGPWDRRRSQTRGGVIHRHSLDCGSARPSAARLGRNDTVWGPCVSVMSSAITAAAHILGPRSPELEES